ncbi:type IV pilus secretin PilQ family protein [uncultured Oxalicibacterium sp.]|uniref:type IV pilus secretin PilQ family protein n=1 Tax=uncultured Oxalicibacterium sp. TaxID=1168540 RepID=UPI00260103A5|nr:type IV pilus secretin PilQ family protein [uncultured Oxalicibacterium sp.]
MVVMCCAMIGSAAYAASNEIQSITSQQQGTNVVVKIGLKNPVTTPPIGFSVTSPARIALDFADTANGTGKGLQDIGLGDVRNVNVVQAGERSRLVFNLMKSLNYATAVDGNAVIVTIQGSGGPATPLNASGLPVTPPAAPIVATRPALRDIDFRRGNDGEGRVIVDLPGNQIPVDVRQVGKKIEVDFAKADLPQILRRRLDVADFGTPVTAITTQQQGDNVRMVIEPKGAWEHSAYQSDSQLVIEVKPIREEPNRLGGGKQNYKGEKLSLNFQNVDVRAVLQVIADFTGLNIITSDTVSGNLTLRLKDVPWDQALDIVMQAKGLDMRRNGSVLWIAPRDELLTKEKLELEQRSQIAELEPLRTETFQLNYQKAESFKQVFGIDGANRSILSKRGSAVVDPRTNQLFVTDIPSKLEEIRALVQKTDIASRQVMIEARIVEATDTFSRNLGAKLAFGSTSTNYTLGGNQSAPNTSGTLPTVGNSSVSLPAAAISGNAAGTVALTLFNAAATRFIGLELSALEADGKGKIISSPRVITADQLKALIEQGEELPYQQATSSGATSISFRKANLKLEVTPQITPDGNVILDVDVTKDSVGRTTPAGFAIDTKHAKTQVLIENGGTVVIGGIFVQTENDTVSKVPVLGDVPVLGNLFKTTGKVSNKTELLIFLTPKILNDKVAIR